MGQKCHEKGWGRGRIKGERIQGDRIRDVKGSETKNDKGERKNRREEARVVPARGSPVAVLLDIHCCITLNKPGRIPENFRCTYIVVEALGLVGPNRAFPSVFHMVLHAWNVGERGPPRLKNIHALQPRFSKKTC